MRQSGVSNARVLKSQRAQLLHTREVHESGISDTGCTQFQRGQPSERRQIREPDVRDLATAQVNEAQFFRIGDWFKLRVANLCVEEREVGQLRNLADAFHALVGDARVSLQIELAKFLERDK